MKRNLKEIAFYIIIIDRNREDHAILRGALQRIFPQVIIESIYQEAEVVKYFSKKTIKPHLILLDMNMPTILVKLVLYLKREHDRLGTIPVAMFNSKSDLAVMHELRQLGVSEFYNDLLQKVELKLITHDIIKRWLC